MNLVRCIFMIITLMGAAAYGGLRLGCLDSLPLEASSPRDASKSLPDPQFTTAATCAELRNVVRCPDGYQIQRAYYANRQYLPGWGIVCSDLRIEYSPLWRL